MGNAVGTHDTRKPDDEPVDVLKNSLDWINTHIEFATHASGGYGPWEFYAQMKGFLPIPEPKGDFRYRYSSCLELEADDDPTYLRETSGLLSTRSGGRNSQPELEYLECLEYFGANRGKTMCHDYAMDMRESYVMKRQKMRYAFMQQNRGWKSIEKFRGKAKEGDSPPYEPPPPSLAQNNVPSPKFYE
eukprot:TCALIF_07463-PA protein Name:"Protein of unknown function" AED:0.03 eAED:0.03 QI:289/0.5/0.66/1/1/1/3/64/187